MEGHTSNLYNEIADQLQCPARALTQEKTAARASRIRRKSTKNRPKSVQNRFWKRSWGILGPSSPQDSSKSAKKRPKRPSRTSPRIQVGSQNRCKIDPEAFQTQYFFVSFVGSRSDTSGDRFSEDPGSENEAKIVSKSMSGTILQKCKILKKTSGFHRFFEDPGGRKSSKNRFQNELRKRCQTTSKKVCKNSQLSAQNDPSRGPSWPQNRCKRLSKSVLKKDRKR